MNIAASRKYWLNFQSFYAVLIVCISVVVCFLAVVLFGVLNEDPTVKASQKATENLYEVVAYEATALHGSIVDKNSTAELSMLRDGADSRIVLQQPIVQSDDIMYWDAEAQAQGDATVLTSHEVESTYACVRYTANLKAKQITVVPRSCSMRLGNNAKEITIDTSKVSAIRRTYNDLYYCYKSYSLDMGGRNASDYSCR